MISTPGGNPYLRRRLLAAACTVVALLFLALTLLTVPRSAALPPQPAHRHTDESLATITEPDDAPPSQADPPSGAAGRHNHTVYSEAELERLLAASLHPSTRHPAGLTVHLAAGPGLLTGPEYHLSFRRGVTKKNRKWKESTGVWMDAQPRVLAGVGADAAARFVRSNRVVREALRERSPIADADAMMSTPSTPGPAGAGTGVAACLYGAFRDDGRVERFWPLLRARLYASAWHKATRGAAVPNASRLSRLDEHPLRFLEPDLFVSTWDFVVEGTSRKDAREYGENRTVWRGHPLSVADTIRRVKGIYAPDGKGNGDWLRGWHVAGHAGVGAKTKCQRMWCVVPLVKAMCLLAVSPPDAHRSAEGARSRFADYRYLLVHRMDRVPEHPFTVRGPSCFAEEPDPLAERRDFSGPDDPRNDTDVNRPLVAGCFLHMGECATFYGYRLFYPDAPIMRGRAIVHLPVSKFDRYDRWTWVSDFTVFGFVDEVARQLLGTIAFVAEALERDPVIGTMRVSAELVNGQGFEVAGIQPLGLNMEFGDVRARARHSSRITTTSCGKSMPGRLVAVCGNYEMRTHKQVGSADCGKRKLASPVDTPDAR